MRIHANPDPQPWISYRLIINVIQLFLFYQATKPKQEEKEKQKENMDLGSEVST